MLVGVGLDVIEVARIRGAVARRGERLLSRLFTPAELEYCLEAAEPERGRRLAARFAAKEAVRKSLGAGRSEAGWRDVEITRAPSGQPGVILHGRLALSAKRQGVSRILISMAHAKDYAAAQATAVGPEDGTGVDDR